MFLPSEEEKVVPKNNLNAPLDGKEEGNDRIICRLQHNTKPLKLKRIAQQRESGKGSTMINETSDQSTFPGITTYMEMSGFVRMYMSIPMQRNDVSLERQV